MGQRVFTVVYMSDDRKITDATLIHEREVPNRRGYSQQRLRSAGRQKEEDVIPRSNFYSGLPDSKLPVFQTDPVKDMGIQSAAAILWPPTTFAAGYQEESL